MSDEASKTRAESIVVEKRRFRPRLPSFLKQTVPVGPAFDAVRTEIAGKRLKTVCEEAKCPNRTHCYARGTLTFQILGAVCTRSCGFCAETFGRPGAVDPGENARVVETSKRLGLKHVVVTSPARDDLADQGAGAFADLVARFRRELPAVTIELLTPDFQGRPDLLDTVFAARPDVFNHNVETVRRLTPKVRSRATYDRSLSALRRAADAGLVSKSGLMVGHGETASELTDTFDDLAAAGVSLVTIGQYLPPSPRHLPLVRIYEPREFETLREEAMRRGFRDVAAGPLVRSSYYADRAAATLKENETRNSERGTGKNEK